MTRRTVARGLLVAALAALCGLHGGTSGRAVAPSPAKPSGPVAALTVRPQALLSKLGLSAGDAPFLRHFRAKVGVPLEQVDCFAVFELSEGGRALLVRTTRRLNTVKLVNAFQGMWCTVGTDIYIPTDGGPAIHFHDENFKEVVIADSQKTMERVLPGLPALRRQLDRGRRHDLTVWARALPAALVAAGPGGQPWRELGGYKPVPGDAREAWLAVDLARGLEVRGEMTCASERGARAGAEPVRTLLELIRVQMLTGIVSGEMQRLAPREHHSSDNVPDWWPLGLLRAAERGLNVATVRAEGKTVRLHARIDVNGKELGRALSGFAKAQGLFTEKRERAAGPGLFFGQRKEEGRGTASPLAYPAPPASEECRPAPPPARTSELPPGTAPTPPGGTPTLQEFPQHPLPPPPLPPAPPASITLTVANVRKEPVVLFTRDAQGELQFQKKLAAGEAADLDTPHGRRWVAVFMSAPYQMTQTVTEHEQTWVIRQPDAAAKKGGK